MAIIARLRSILYIYYLKLKGDEMDETAYLLRSPKNAARLLQSIEDHKNGLGKERSLIEK